MTYKNKPSTFSELKRRINAYFRSRLAPLTDKNGAPVTDANGKIIKKIALPYTLTGLALALGCQTREELMSFDDPEMQRYIKMSIMKVEEFAEEKLFSKEAFSGVKLFLATNFDRWKENSFDEEQEERKEYSLPDAIAKWSV